MRTVTYFQSLLKPLSMKRFQRFVNASDADKHTKGFKSRHLLLAMVAGQIQGARSYRELEVAFNAHQGAFYPLGARPVRRSTLSDALQKRSTEPFKRACEHLMSCCHRQLRRDCHELLYLIDSTNIPLYDKAFDSWTWQHRSDRLRGLKLHTQIESSQAVPVYANIDHANVNDVTDAHNLTIEPGATYTFDKGYTAYNWWKQIDDKGAFFVTRIKKNAKCELQRTHTPASELPEPIISDQILCLTNRHPGGRRINHYAHQPLRVVTVARDDKSTPLKLVTNDFERSAEQVADIYKKRWGVELFFKWIKQHLKIKRFLGSSENAVRLQLYSALIAYLLVAIKHYSQRTSGTLRASLLKASARLFVSSDIERRYHRRRYHERKRQRERARWQLSLLEYSGQ